MLSVFPVLSCDKFEKNEYYLALIIRNYNDVLFSLTAFYLSHNASFVTGPCPVVLSLDVHQYFLTFVMTVKNFCACSSAAYDPLIGFLHLVGTHPAIFENISSFRTLFNHLRKARIYFYYASWMQFLSIWQVVRYTVKLIRRGCSRLSFRRCT